jgi:membrane-bound lytic murein transglycosylase A
MRQRIVAVALILLALAATGFYLWEIAQAPVTGPLRFRAIAFADLPGWSQSDARGALDAFRRSCGQLAKQASDAALGGTGYAGKIVDWRSTCNAVPAKTPGAAAARAFFQAWFAPLSVSAGDAQDGLFTGYYEPELRVSHTAQGSFRTPVYGVPDDLIRVDLGAFRPTLKGEHLAGRVENHMLVPYATRAAIEAKPFAAPVLFYADDPIAVFFLHIQGSGRAVFDDGSAARISYAAENGQPYTAIGRTLIAQGALMRENVSLQSIRAWLIAHPKDAQHVMATNASFVFFKEEPVGDPTLGSKGAEGVALTPGASLAVDPRIHPLGVPFFVATTRPSENPGEGDVPFRKLLVAQDIGGAIRGPVRGDVFWGFGRAAEAIAGRMKQTGQLYVLLPKKLAARLGGAQP